MKFFEKKSKTEQEELVVHVQGPSKEEIRAEKLEARQAAKLEKANIKHAKQEAAFAAKRTRMEAKRLEIIAKNEADLVKNEALTLEATNEMLAKTTATKNKCEAKILEQQEWHENFINVLKEETDEYITDLRLTVYN